MVFETQALSWKHRIKRPFAWLFAIAMGLLVSIADVKLPAETNQDPAAGYSRLLPQNADTIPDSAGAFSDEIDAPDSFVSEFVPAREPSFDSFDLFVHQAAGRYDVDFDLIRAIISAESQFNPRARSKKAPEG